MTMIKELFFAKIIGSDSIKINRKRTYYVKFYSDESCTEEIECTNYTWHVSDDIQVKKKQSTKIQLKY